MYGSGAASRGTRCGTRLMATTQAGMEVIQAAHPALGDFYLDV